MRVFLWRTAFVAASVSLIFFCSCERHKPGELSHEEHMKAADTAEHQKSGDKEMHKAEHPSATPVGTPAQFFPSPTP